MCVGVCMCVCVYDHWCTGTSPGSPAEARVSGCLHFPAHPAENVVSQRREVMRMLMLLFLLWWTLLRKYLESGIKAFRFSHVSWQLSHGFLQPKARAQGHFQEVPGSHPSRQDITGSHSVTANDPSGDALCLVTLERWEHVHWEISGLKAVMATQFVWNTFPWILIFEEIFGNYPQNGENSSDNVAGCI